MSLRCRVYPIAAAALLPALWSGCASFTRPWHVQATVTAAPPCTASAGAPPAAPAPLAGAEVSTFCPQLIKANSLVLLGTTDARGALHFEENPLGAWIHDHCEIVVQKPGYEEQRFPVAEVCKEYSANHCMRAVISAELSPPGVRAPRCR